MDALVIAAKELRSLVVGAVVGVALWSPAHAKSGDTMSVRPFMFSPSTKTEPVIFDIKGSTFRIPRNYLQAAEAKDGDVHLLILTWLPDFVGWSPSIKSQYDSRDKGVAQRAIEIYVQSGANSAVGRNNMFLDIPAEKMDAPDESGLRFLREHPFSPNLDAFLHKANNQKDSTVIICFREPPFVCHVYLDPSPKILMRYEFKRTQLKDWALIKSGVLQLWHSFDAGGVK